MSYSSTPRNARGLSLLDSDFSERPVAKAPRPTAPKPAKEAGVAPEPSVGILDRPTTLLERPLRDSYNPAIDSLPSHLRSSKPVAPADKATPIPITPATVSAVSEPVFTRVAPRPAAPRNVIELLEEARHMAEIGVSQDDIVEYVYSVAGGFGLRMSHDQHANAAIQETKVAPPEFRLSPDEAPEESPPDESTTPTGEQSIDAKRANGKGSRRRAKSAAAVNVPVIRQRDGSHLLDISKILGLAPRPAATEQSMPEKGLTVGRLVLGSGRRGAARAPTSRDSRWNASAAAEPRPLQYECNGLVIDARTWRVLSMPPGAFDLRPSAKKVDAYLARNLYDIVRVDDGTVVTLYSWVHPTDGAIWALSTSNAYDVSALKWIGERTYASVIFDLFTRLYPDFVAETRASFDEEKSRLDFENLSRSYCYTFGFRHHDFHPLIADPERIWQIQHTDVSGPVPRVIQGGRLPHVPQQRWYRAEDLIEHISARCGVATAITCEGLSALGSDALSSAKTFVAAAARRATEPTALDLNYGYILRTREPEETRELSYVLIETPLLARVRRIMYERAPPIVRDHLGEGDRLDYNTMRALLTSTDRPDFEALYPNLVPRLRFFDSFLANITKRVSHILRQKAMNSSDDGIVARTASSKVADALVKHIKQFENLTALTSAAQQVIHDYAYNPEYAYLYLRAVQVTEAC